MIVGHIGGAGAGAPYEIQKSLRFRASALAYLGRTPTVVGNRKTWTWSGWVKRGALGAGPFTLFSATNSISADAFDFTNDGLRFTYYTGTTTVLRQSTGVFRDASAWYHLMWVLDTSNATAQDRLRAYVNGIEITAWSTNVVVPLNQQFALNNNVAHTLGSNLVGNQVADGYLSEVNFIDGQALTPSSFGEFSAETGAWIPKKYTGTYGTNGFYLPFNDGSNLTNLTADRSGNGNNWTANNISLTSGSSYDWMDDTPTNNYAVLNPLDIDRLTGTLSQANLYITQSTACNAAASAYIGSGKWYAEFFVANRGSTNNTGAAGVGTGFGIVSTTGVSQMYNPNGNKRIDNVDLAVSWGTPIATNQVVGVAVDLDAKQIEVFIDGVSQGSQAYTTSGEYAFYMFTRGAATNPASAFNAGQRPFAYTPPAGFKALCTKNLPTPSILNPKKHFDVVLATGANIKSTVEALYSDQALMIVKDRSNSNNWQWFNDLIGTNAILQSNTTSTETTYVAPSGSSVGFAIKAASAPVANNAGSIQSQVSANPQAGFSIVTYTGTGANATVGHGLGVAPKLIIAKSRTSGTDGWPVYHASLGAGQYLGLSGTGAASTVAPIPWNSVAPSSTVFNVSTSTGVNALSGSYVAYCFAEIPGYSKIGSYTGNGSADGPFVYCGFRPRYVLIKASSLSEGWIIFDTARNTTNVMNAHLYPHLSNSETISAGNWIDITSNGFKLRGSDTALNASGGAYIFMVFAETPFKYANAR